MLFAVTGSKARTTPYFFTTGIIIMTHVQEKYVILALTFFVEIDKMKF